VPGRYSRRRFLGIAGGAAAVVTVGVPRDLVWADATVPAAGARDPITRLGRAYLDLTPDEDSVDTLFDLVPGLRRGQPVVEQLPGLEPKVTSDFARRRTVSIDGWHLSRTEARVAALHALGR
jgi:hypothetical protein